MKRPVLVFVNWNHMFKLHLSALFFLLNLSHVNAQWGIQEDYSISFNGRGAEGSFSGLSGKIQFDPDDLESASFLVKIDPSTISTGNKTKDKHARGSSWFNVSKYPEITFSSKEITKEDQGFRMVGDLKMHGITREISFPFAFDRAESQGVFEGRLVINREDYDILGPLVSFMVDEEFKVEITVPVTKLD